MNLVDLLEHGFVPVLGPVHRLQTEKLQKSEIFETKSIKALKSSTAGRSKWQSDKYTHTPVSENKEFN